MLYVVVGRSWTTSAVNNCFVFFRQTPSLQVLRAETLVERFTARMHVFFRLWLSIGRTKSQNEFATKEPRWNKGSFYGTENFENRKFHEILTLVTSEAIIFNEFSSLTRISLPCGAHVYYYHMTRRAVSCKSNTGTGVFRPN